MRWCNNSELNDNDKEELKNQMIAKKDELNWMKSWALLGLKRKDEALKIIGNFRHKDGDFKAAADSLYNLISAQ